MALWTDIVDPATATGYVRASLSDYEAQKGSLARFVPNTEVPDIFVRFRTGDAGLAPEGRYRDYDAEPEVAKGPRGKRVTLELPAISLEVPVSEYEQLRLRGADDNQVEASILKTVERVARGIADRVERMRGTVLTTGKATIAQDNYNDEADYGRVATHTVTAGTLWSASADPLADLNAWMDVYRATNGVAPGALVMSSRVARVLAAKPAFATVLAGGGSRPGSIDEVQAVLAGYGLPSIEINDRRTAGGRVIPDDTVLLLPEPVDPNGGESELGATFWGQTLTASSADYGLSATEMPGIVAGVYRNPKPPMIAECIGDSVSLPVLANANLSFAAKVL